MDGRYLRFLLVVVLYYSASFFRFFFFKQKTAYEMRISDWSSDVCSSDLVRMRPRSVPQCGSVRHMVPDQRPCAMFGRKVRFCASLPCISRALQAPWVRPGYMPKERLVEQISSVMMNCRV